MVSEEVVPISGSDQSLTARTRIIINFLDQNHISHWHWQMYTDHRLCVFKSEWTRGCRHSERTTPQTMMTDGQLVRVDVIGLRDTHADSSNGQFCVWWLISGGVRMRQRVFVCVSGRHRVAFSVQIRMLDAYSTAYSLITASVRCDCGCQSRHTTRRSTA